MSDCGGILLFSTFGFCLVDEDITKLIFGSLIIISASAIMFKELKN